MKGEMLMLPEKFTERMRRLLGNEYPAFERAMTSEDAVRGFRINTVKARDPERIRRLLAEEAVPYEENGYVLKNGISIGRLAEHHSGAVYVQDPGAMAALAAVDIKKGIKAIDLCAAPGGKSSKIAECIGDEGFLISNEIVPKRAKILVGNFERLGIKNAAVTSLDTSEFKKLFDGAFDLVLVDAPCSGEGMFRKDPDAVAEWSEENVIASAKRQREIMNNAAPLVRCGGTLVYSTCTFSTEENEENVIAFLKEHADFELCRVHERIMPYTSPGIDTDGAFPEIALAARRFYPHVSGGEGQFVALLKKRGTDSGKDGVLFKTRPCPLKGDDARTVSNFFEETLLSVPSGHLVKQGDNVVLISHGAMLPPRSVFSAGVLVGEIRKGLLFPAHQFFSAFGDLFKNRIDLKGNGPLMRRYLSGEEIEVNADIKGWCAVLADGAPLGGGKASCGRLKNHYPKGLRSLG